MNKGKTSPRSRSLALQCVFAVSVSMLVGGCAVGDGSSRPPTPTAQSTAPKVAANASPHLANNDAPIPSVEMTPHIMFQILASEILAQRGDFGTGTRTYLSIAKDTRDPRLARRATELAIAGRSLENALPAAQLWQELAPESSLASQTLETLWLSTGKLEEAEPLMARRLAEARTRNQAGPLYQRLQGALTRVNDKKAALAMIDRLSAPDLELGEARLARAALAHAAGERERAVAEAKAAMMLQPDNDDAAIAAAQYAQSAGDANRASIEILESFITRNPKSIEARFTLARLLGASGRQDDARAQFEQALKLEPNSPSILFSLARLAVQTGQPAVAEGYLKRYVGLPASIQRDNAAAYLFLGQIAEDAKRYDDAIGWYAKIERGQHYLNARLRRAIALGKLGRLDEGRELLRTTAVGKPQDRVRLTSAEAQLLRDAKRFQEAYELLEEALKGRPDDADLLYDFAMTAERIERIDVLETSLRKVIALRPRSAHAYNALGYTLADRNIRLEEAQQLIEKALEIAPKDAHILDSMGWVRFRRGDLVGAEKYLREALALDKEAEIATHLGEVLWQSGRQGEAREMWAMARQLQPDSELLRDTLARLNVSLP